MMDVQYLSVKDFASAAGVSTQRIYQMLPSDLKEFCKEIDGKKRLSTEGLRLFSKSSLPSSLQSDLPNKSEDLPNIDGLTKQFTKHLQEQQEQGAQALRETIEVLRQQVDAMQQQLTVKDEQLRTKDVQIAEKDKQLERLSSALENTTAALTAAQALHAGTIQERLTTEQQQPQSEHDSPAAPEEQDEPAPKQSLFARIFKKK